MSLFGRLLLCVNLVLSVCFLSLAGAVYTTQTTWKDRHAEVEAKLTQTQNSLREAEAAKNDAEKNLSSQVATAEADRDTFKGKLDIATSQLEAVTRERDLAEAKFERQQGLAATQSQEAIFRTEESLMQRTVNEKLHERLEETTQQLSQVQDNLFTEQLEKSQIEREYLLAAEQLNSLRQQVAVQQSAGGSPIVARRDTVAPPPEVDGRIISVRKNDVGLVELVELTIGSDDGLKEGQSLIAFRPARGGEGAKFLGEVYLVAVDNDGAVGRVENPQKAISIERGDYVTSRL